MSKNVTKCHTFSNLWYKATFTFYVWIRLGTALSTRSIYNIWRAISKLRASWHALLDMAYPKEPRKWRLLNLVPGTRLQQIESPPFPRAWQMVLPCYEKGRCEGSRMHARNRLSVLRGLVKDRLNARTGALVRA